MLFTADDMAAFDDPDLGAVEATHRPAAGGSPITGLVHIDQAGKDMFGGTLAGVDLVIDFDTTVFQDVKRGDRFEVGRTDYIVRDVPENRRDGLRSMASLAKQH